jgi:hypothetical protein
MEKISLKRWCMTFFQCHVSCLATPQIVDEFFYKTFLKFLSNFIFASRKNRNQSLCAWHVDAKCCYTVADI